MMSGRGLPRGRRTKTKTIALLRLCLFLIFLVVFLLILNICTGTGSIACHQHSYCDYIESLSTLALSHFLMSSEKGSNVRRIMFLKCVDCCLFSSYHLNKAQDSEAACSLYFKCFDCFEFSVMNHLEKPQVSKAAAALISTPHLRSPTPAGCPFVPPQKVFEDRSKIFMPLPVSSCAPTKMYFGSTKTCNRGS